MADSFFPDLHNLFTEIKSGRKLSYTPLQIVEEFEKYIEDLKAHEMELKTEYKKQGKKGETNTSQEAQIRLVKFTRPPRVTDFVMRWLGKSYEWWQNLEKGKRGDQFLKVRKYINEYCYNCNLDGAIVGAYNANIIARQLGLRDKQEIITRTATDEELTEEEITQKIANFERLRALRNNEENNADK